MKLIGDAATLKNLINQPSTVVFVIVGSSVDAMTLASNAAHGEGTLGSLTHIVAQVNPATVVDDALLDPTLRLAPSPLTSADLGCTTGQTGHTSVFTVGAGGAVDLATATQAWITGDAN